MEQTKYPSIPKMILPSIESLIQDREIDTAQDSIPKRTLPRIVIPIEDREIFQPKWNCFCCEDSGIIKEGLMRLVDPSYDINSHGYYRCDNCEKYKETYTTQRISESSKKGGCSDPPPIGTDILNGKKLDAETCHSLHKLNKEQWEKTAKEQQKEIVSRAKSEQKEVVIDPENNKTNPSILPNSTETEDNIWSNLSVQRKLLIEEYYSIAKKLGKTPAPLQRLIDGDLNKIADHIEDLKSKYSQQEVLV